MPHTKPPSRILLVVAMLLVLAALPACKGGSAADNDDCEALAEKRVAAMETLEELEGVLDAMPTDAVRYSEQTEEELMRFSQLFVQLNDQIEAMHDEHEVACKWPMIEDGDFNAVFENVYRPHIELLGRQRRAVLDVADALEKAGPKDVVGDAVDAYRDVGDRLRDGMAMQLQVCEDDFAPDSCDPFKDAIRAAVSDDAVTAATTPDTKTGGESSGGTNKADKEPESWAPDADDKDEEKSEEE